MSNETEKRFFYHSFPRRGCNAKSEIKNGCRILELIRDVGLLLTPEIISWEYPHADGSPPRQQTILQRRACFTELAPSQLAEHSKAFGHFALEFEIEVLKDLGALPVFYIPKKKSADLGSSLGQTLVVQAMDAMCLVDRMAKVKKFIETAEVGGSRQNFSFGFTEMQKVFSLDIDETQRSFSGVSYGLTPLEMLSNSLEGMLNFFYPTDDTSDDSTLKYYRQREWRITGNIAFRGEELMRRPSAELITALLALDADFFGKEFPPNRDMITNPSLLNEPVNARLVDWIYAFPGIAGKSIIELASRIIVPSEALDSVKAIVATVNNPPMVVSTDTLQP